MARELGLIDTGLPHAWTPPRRATLAVEHVGSGLPAVGLVAAVDGEATIAPGPDGAVTRELVASSGAGQEP
jgi:hypothetical protein